MFSSRRTRLFTALVTVTALIVSLSACAGSNGSGNQSASDASAATTSNPAEKVDPLGKYENPVTVNTVLITDPGMDGTLKKMAGESYENNRFTSLYKDKLNIDLKFSFIADSSQYNNKVNVTIASGDIPDFMPVNTEQTKRLIEAGMVVPVEEVFEKYAVAELKNAYSYESGISWKPFMDNGKKMAIPKTVLDTVTNSADLLWYRSDWLKKLNMSEPKTMDDVLNLIRAFTLKDPDGNGKQDTYGVGINNALWSYMGNLTGFFNGCNAYPNQWLEDKSGNLVSGNIQPEVKEALKKLQQLYKEGCLDKEFAVKKDQQVREDYWSGKCGLVFSQLASGIRLADTKKSIPDAEWKVMQVPGKTGVPVSTNMTGYVISKKFKNPEALVKMMNLTVNMSLSGSKDDFYKYVDSPDLPQSFKINPVGDLNIFAQKNIYLSKAINDAIKTNDTKAAYAKISKNAYESDFQSTYDKVSLWTQNKDINGYGMYLVFGPQGSGMVCDNIIENKAYILDKFIGSPTKTMAEKKSTLDKMRDETFVKIIMGAADVDGEFDKFVNSWKSLGGDAMTKEVNDWYATSKGK